MAEETFPVSDLITDAAIFIGDERSRRITRPLWLLFYNRTTRWITSRLKALEGESYFDIQPNDRYEYPLDLVTLRSVRYTDVPADPDSYGFLGEIFDDQYRQMVNRRYPVGTPTRYIARATYFQLVARPELAIANGGLLHYWKLASRISDETSALMELPSFMRDYVMDGMTIHAKRTLRLYAEAADDDRVWRAAESDVRTQIEDRSSDRRSQIRPRSLSRRSGLV